MDKVTYFKQLTGDAAINEISVKTGLSVSTLWRQYNKGCDFNAEALIIIARAYEGNPVEALVQFGFLTNEEAKQGETNGLLRDASNDELLQELARRLKRTPTGPTARSSTARNTAWPRTMTPTRDWRPRRRKTDETLRETGENVEKIRFRRFSYRFRANREGKHAAHHHRCIKTAGRSHARESP